MAWMAAAVVATVVLGGCSLPIIQKRAYDFQSTALFKQPCDENLPPGEYEIALNQCNSLRMLRMVDRFMSIEETDEGQGQEGDTIKEVRSKGFSIYLDEEKRLRRPNTRVLYGNEALAAVGMGVSPPPLSTPKDVRDYANFMSQHYAEEYIERDMAKMTDRFCINNRESLELGEDRIFTILWREGRVFKRIIKGGPVNNPKQERAFLVCPGGFIVELFSSGVKSMSPLR